MSDLVDFILSRVSQIPDDGIIEPEQRIRQDDFVLGSMTVGESKFYTVCRTLQPIITRVILDEFITEESTIHPQALQMLEQGSGRVLWETFDQTLKNRFGLPGRLWPGTRKGFRVVILQAREERPFQYTA